MVINIQDKQSQHKAMSAWDDILVIDDQLSSEEKILKSSVRTYCQEKLLPRIIDDNRNENSISTVETVIQNVQNNNQQTKLTEIFLKSMRKDCEIDRNTNNVENN